MIWVWNMGYERAGVRKVQYNGAAGDAVVILSIPDHYHQLLL
jgi:hypothetical protein